MFSYLADLVSKKLFQNFGRRYLGQIWEMDAMEVTQGGSDTHNDPHETGAARTAARPFILQKKKNILESIKSFSTSDYYKFVFIHIEIDNSCLVK